MTNMTCIVINVATSSYEYYFPNIAYVSAYAQNGTSVLCFCNRIPINFLRSLV